MDSKEMPGPSHAFRGGGGDTQNCGKKFPNRNMNSGRSSTKRKAPGYDHANNNFRGDKFDGSEIRDAFPIDDPDDPHEPDSIPPISIHRIIQTKASSRPAPYDDEEAQIIDEIMEKIRTRNPRSGDYQYKLRYWGKLGEIVERKERRITKKSKTQSNQSGFKTRVYVKQKFIPHPLLVYFNGKESAEKTSSLNIIWFLYRPGDIFALTTDCARHDVQPFIDYSFQTKVAARLGSIEGPKRKVEKMLAGNVELVSKLVKRAEGYGKVTDPPLLCKNFTAALKPNASIFRLDAFHKAAGKHQVWMTFGFGSIRIKKRIKIPHFSLIMNHLSIIQKGQNTQTFEEGGKGQYRNEVDTDVYHKDFTKVPSDLSQDLDNDLIDRVRRSLMVRAKKFRPISSSSSSKNDDDPSSSFDFSYVYDEQILSNNSENSSLSSKKFNIEYNSKKVDLPLNPTLTHVLDILANHVGHKLTSVQDFTVWIKNKVRLNGNFVEKKKKLRNPAQNLLSCLEGETFFGEGESGTGLTGNLYWRVQNLWCTVNPHFFITVHQWFGSFLTQSLIQDPNEHHLFLPWPERKQVKNYVDSYLHLTPNSRGAYCRPPESCCQLSDLVYFDNDSGSIFFYFISTNFVTQTKNICGRIHHCRQKLVKATEYLESMTDEKVNGTNKKGHDAAAEYFKTFFESLTEKIGSKYMGTYRQFLVSLSNATLVYVLATNDQQPNVTFLRDSQLPVVVEKKKLQQHLKNISDPILGALYSFIVVSKKAGKKVSQNKNEKIKLIAEKILEELETQNYTQNNGLVTVKLIYAEFNKFDLPILVRLFQEKVPTPVSQVAGQLFKKVLFNFLNEFKPSFSSLGARLELRELKNQSTLCQSGIQFKMCQIPIITKSTIITID